MKTILITFALLISSNLLAAPRHTKLKVQGAMKTYVNKLISNNGFLPVIHEGKVLKLELSRTEKYPDGFHSGVATEGNLYTSCADFVDNNGKKYDIDFLVSRVGEKYSVVQPIVHSIDGKKSRYDLDH